jgi:histidinol dehydrogenase
MVAVPSEVLVIADGAAMPADRRDLLAEPGTTNAQSILVTDGAALAMTPRGLRIRN